MDKLSLYIKAKRVFVMDLAIRLRKTKAPG